MYQALLYKEWIKIRWALLIVSGISLWTLVQLVLLFRENFEFVNAMKIWTNVIHRKLIFYEGLKYNALIAGVGIALVQFVPETLKRRLRLLFHLPVSHVKSLYFMMGAGLGCVFFVILLNLVCLVFIIAHYFPSELVWSAVITTAPWFFSGVVAYFGTVLVVVEPVWWRRCAYAVVSFSVVLLYLNGGGYNTYAQAFWKYALLGGLYLFTVLLPAFRFKRGLY
jgi:hypothetical protein